MENVCVFIFCNLLLLNTGKMVMVEMLRRRYKRKFERILEEKREQDVQGKEKGKRKAYEKS